MRDVRHAWHEPSHIKQHRPSTAPLALGNAEGHAVPPMMIPSHV